MLWHLSKEGKIKSLPGGLYLLRFGGHNPFDYLVNLGFLNPSYQNLLNQFAFDLFLIGPLIARPSLDACCQIDL